MKSILTTRFIVRGAAIAAVYAALTLIFAPISYGPVQFRVSESLAVLVLFTPAAVPGLFVGCALANLIGGFGLYDIVLGSLATLGAAAAGYALRRNKWLVPIPAVLINALVIGPMLYFIYELGDSALWSIAYVALGQIMACCVLGYPLMLLFGRFGAKRLFGIQNDPQKIRR